MDPHNLRIRDLGESLSILSGHTAAVTCVTVIEENEKGKKVKHIVSGSEDKTIRIWNILTGSCLHILSGHTGKIYDIGFTQSMKIISCSDDGTVKIWEKSNNSDYTDYNLCYNDDQVMIVGVLPDERIACLTSGQISVWNPRTKKCDLMLSDRAVTSFTVSPSGYLISGSLFGKICVTK